MFYYLFFEAFGEDSVKTYLWRSLGSSKYIPCITTKNVI